MVIIFYLILTSEALQIVVVGVVRGKLVNALEDIRQILFVLGHGVNCSHRVFLAPKSFYFLLDCPTRTIFFLVDQK